MFYYRWHEFLLMLISAALLRASAQSINYFINPQPPGPTSDYRANNVYVVGSKVNLQWSTNFPTLSLVLYQDDGNDSSIYVQHQVTALSFLAWPVNLTGLYDLNDGQVFFFIVYDESGSGKSFNSHYFNITEAETSAVPSSSTSSSTISSTLESPTTSRVSSVVTPSTTANPTSSSSAAPIGSGLSSGTKLGIGAGVGVGALCLLLGFGLGWICLKRRGLGGRDANARSTHTLPQMRPVLDLQEPDRMPTHNMSMAPMYQANKQPTWAQTLEMNALRDPQELHA